MAINFSLPSQNQLLQAGLGVLGAGFDRNINPFLAASQGIAQGKRQDLLEKQEERQAAADARAQAAFDMQQRQNAAWQALWGTGLPSAGDLARTPGIAPQPGEGAPISLLPPVMGGSPGDQLAAATPRNLPAPAGGVAAPPQNLPAPVGGVPGATVQNLPATNSSFQRNLMAGLPQGSAPLLAAMGPQAGGRFLLEQMIKGPPQRRIVDGADGYKYYADTGERVLPDVQARDPDLLSPEALTQQTQLRQAGRSTTNISNVLGTEKLTPAQEAIDKAYAKDHADFVLGGGYADAQKNLEQMQEVITAIEGPGELTGTITARLPDWARAFVDPEGLNVQQLTEEVVQRNLREVLGAQFTEREGERLIARAYDPRLDEATNLARLKRLTAAMREGLEARQQASLYLEEKGTMRGYEGAKRITIRDLERALDAPAPPGSGAGKFEGLSADELLNFDVNAIETEEDVRQYEEALRAAGAL